MQPEERLERVERQLEFLAAHQAQMVVTVEKHSEQIAQLGDFLLRAARFSESLARRTEERFAGVAEAQRRTEERFVELVAAQQRTEEHMQRTDERLNVLVNIVERYFSDGRQE